MAQINMRIDDEVKKNAEIVCDEIGISMAAAINIYLKRLGKEHRIPFEVRGEVPNKETIKAMEDVKNNVGISRGYSSVKDLMEDLNADD